MDGGLREHMRENSKIYKKSLDRIIDKYSKLQYCDGGIEVDLDNTKTRTLESYMTRSEKKLNILESKSFIDLKEESLRAQDILTESQLDLTHEDSESYETLSSSNQSYREDNGMAGSDTTQLTISSLNESERSFSETMLQPEDQDEELEMTLRSNGSLVELYPSMISRIERAWHQKNVCDAADSVRRRYHKWRQHSNRSNNSNTFLVTLGQSKSREKTGRILFEENSPEKRQYKSAENAPRSPFQAVKNLHDWKPLHQSPSRERGLRGEQNKPILAMDFSGPPETSNQKEMLLNETFTVSELPQLREQSYTHSASPSRSCFPSVRASLDKARWARRLSLSSNSEQAGGCSVFAVKERPDIYGSPVRRSPSKARTLTSFSGSPHSFSRSPKESCVESFSRDATRSPTLSTLVSSPQRNPTSNMRVRNSQDSNHCLQLQLPSPQSTSAEKRLRLRRHLSFDSSQPSFRVSCSQKTLDDDFKKLYHKFVCQNKSSFLNGPPCRLCAERSGASQGHSSSALAALALSPHRSVLRKRPRELSWYSNPQSKRSREEFYTYSPGSKRHGNEVLRHRLSASQLEKYQDYFPYSSSKHMFQKVRSQQQSADTWMNQGRRLSAAEFSGLGGIFESTVANSYSPRKW